MGAQELWTRSLRGKHRFYRGLSSAGWPGVAFLTSQLGFSAPELSRVYTHERSKARAKSQSNVHTRFHVNPVVSLP